VSGRRRLPALVLLAALPAAAVEARAQERVLLRRYSDIVVVRESADAREEVLYYFDPTRELPQGAQIQQGVGGFSQLRLSGGALLSLHASTHLVLERLGPEGDIVRVAQLSLLEVVGGSRKLELALPGGTRCLLQKSTLVVEVVPGRLRVRNQIGEPVSVTGLIGVSPAAPGAAGQAGPGQGRVLLQAGQEIQIPMYFGEQPAGGMSAQRWAGRLVRHGPGAQLSAEGPRLRVERDADGVLHETASVEVGGVTTMPGPGRLVVEDPRPMADTTAPQQVAPPPAAPPAAAPAAAPAAPAQQSQPAKPPAPPTDPPAADTPEEDSP
jgi:hypothetical protein